MKLVYDDLKQAIREVQAQAETRLADGSDADEFLKLAEVGDTSVFIAATQDYPRASGPRVPHANPQDCLLYLLDGSMTITFSSTGDRCTVGKGGFIKVPAGTPHTCECQKLTTYLSVVDNGSSRQATDEAEILPQTRILRRGKDSDGADFKVVYHPRPSPRVRESILSMAEALTGKWFTARVPSDTAKDLLFQRAVVYTQADADLGFVVFTSCDGALQITLIGTRPEHHRRGIGSTMLLCLRSLALDMGFDIIRALMIPPEANPAYAGTLEFYTRVGFCKTRLYADLWEHGAIELEWRLNEG